MPAKRLTRKAYHQNIRQALDNEFLGQTLADFCGNFKTNQPEVFAGLDLDALTDEVTRVKGEALSRLPQLFEEFKERAEAAGAKVHLAATADEANALIASIARAGGVSKIIKSKSMTTEEIFLNRHLEEEGFQVTETDLGEWIIQLRHEGPSHMILPAIHLSRRQVAELFTEVTGQAQDPEDITTLVRVARKRLRSAFLEADMGITGSNIAIAETGTFIMLTNEGNGRLVNTLPRIHVAVVGLEKLVPDLQAALAVLRVLPRKATGQTLTSYMSWITGAAPWGPTGETKELHIVFLDNGRLALAKDPVFSEALRCIRCGACANVCPIYGLVGGHNYGHIYVGAIGLLLSYFYHGAQNAAHLLNNCLNCQACKAVCPSKIDLPRLIKEAAGRVARQEGGRPARNALLARVMKDRRLFHSLLRLAKTGQRPLAGGQPLMRHLPFFFSREQSFKSLPVMAKRPLRDIWPEIRPKVSQPRLRVALFGGCLIDFVYPEKGRDLVKLLAGREVALEYPEDQTCCGLPVRMMTETETAREVAAQNIKALPPAEYDYILTLCASCASHMKTYPLLLKDHPLAQEAEAFAAKVIDFSSFMVDVLGSTAEDFQPGAKKAAYHSPCHLCRGLGVTSQPRQLLKAAGLEYVPLADEDVCCGFGGLYSLDYPEISSTLLEQKLERVEKAVVDLLVTDCPGCLLQLQGGMDKRGGGVVVKHLVEVVAPLKP